MCSRLQFERNSDRTVLRAVCLECAHKWIVKDEDFVFNNLVKDSIEFFGNPWDSTVVRTEGDPWILKCHSCGTEGVVADLRIRPIRTFKPTTSCFAVFDPEKDLGLLNEKKWMSSTWRTFWKAYEAKGLSKDGKNTMSIKDACRRFKDLNSLYQKIVNERIPGFTKVLWLSNIKRPVKPLMEEFMGLDNPLYLSRSVMDLVSKRVGIVLIHDYSHASREIRNRWDLKVPSDRMWYDNNEDVLNGPEFSMSRGKPHIPDILPNGEMNRKGLWVQWDAKKKHHTVFDEGMTLVGYDESQGEDDSYNPYEDYEEVLNDPETTEEDLQEAADSYFKSVIE